MSDSNDRALGMDRDISRRDFINGTAVAIGALMSGPAFATGPGPAASAQTYPPAKMGLRGSHPGSFEAAHDLRDGRLSMGSAEDTRETYDLVVVGGGLSGLAAAHFYLKSVGPSARVLILDNHDDFGGHAKRNEFRVDGKLLAINGGTLNVESPARYNQWARQVLDDIGIDIARYETENESNSKLYSSMGLKRGYFFDKETWKNDRLVVPTGIGRGTARLMNADLPLSPKAKADLNRLLAPDQPDYLAGKSVTEKKAFLATTSLKDYYLDTIKIDPQVMWFFQTTGHGTFCVGADATPALFGWVQNMPGFSGLGLGAVPEGLFADLPGGQHGRQREGGKSVHFPDGNATLARLLAAKLIPDATAARTQEVMGTAVIDYGRLDQAGQPARIRLSSIVVNVRHDGEPWSATEAVVSYVQGGRLKSVRGKSVILACWNMVIPYMMPELPKAQKEALAYGVKGPLVYTNVALRNWRSFEKLGISGVQSPTMFHEGVELTEAASLGGLKHPTSPNEPVALHISKTMAVPGLPRRDQHRAGRAMLLDLTFEQFERETRSQLARILGPGGFDPARDIAGITVNRWPHGYAYTYNSLYDPVEWVYTETPERPCVKGRQPYGLISIANSDAAASPHTDAAFLEAHRAVAERIERQTYPFTKG
ncbi:MAG: NAD(P)/FAD-dependent oxidoreductase [Sphingobium sp.]